MNICVWSISGRFSGIPLVQRNTKDRRSVHIVL